MATTETTLAEFTIREVRDGDNCRVQYIVDGKVLLEGKEYPVSLYGHPYYSKMVEDSLKRIQEKEV